MSDGNFNGLLQVLERGQNETNGAQLEPYNDLLLELDIDGFIREYLATSVPDSQSQVFKFSTILTKIEPLQAVTTQQPTNGEIEEIVKDLNASIFKSRN